MMSVIHRPVLIGLAFLMAASGVAAQTLDIRSVGELELVTVVLPMADATTIAWVESDATGRPVIRHRIASTITASAELEAVLAGGASDPIPPVVVVCGTLRPDETAELVASLTTGRGAAEIVEAQPTSLMANAVNRRLAPPGTTARIRLRLPLPPWGAPSRPSAEVAGGLLPRLVAAEVEGVRGKVDGDSVVLVLRTAGELAEHDLQRLRLALNTVTAAPRVDPGWVERSATALGVRHAAGLASHPQGALELAECWLAGREHGVRQRLFGLSSVGPESVESTLREWFAVHPGGAELLLPPQVLNPRFATSPRQLALDNGLILSFLERPATPFAAACLRPVLRPDVSGDATATVLTRVALVLRNSADAPGWVRVGTDPVRLEIGTSADGFPELCQVLAEALRRVAEDDSEVVTESATRSRALQLMAGQLGLQVGGTLSPSALLRPENLVLGAVVDDAEVAADAAAKLLAPILASGPITSSAGGSGSPLTRAVIGGDRSTIAVSLPWNAGGEPGAAEMVRDVLETRLQSVVDGSSVELHDVTTAGGRVLVVVLSARHDLPAFEGKVREAWPDVTGPVAENELGVLRKQVAASVAARASGPVGRALLCTDVVAGFRPWVPPSQRQMWLLQVGVDEVNALLEPWSVWSKLRTTAAGPVPVDDASDRPR